MSKNITLFGKAYPDTPAIIVPKTGGGTARFDDVSGVTAVASDVKAGKKIVTSDGVEITGTYNWSWMGSEVEHLNDLDYTETFTLADTDYPNWTPSTTAGNIRDSHTAFTFTADMANYDYLAMFLMEFDPKYEENAMMVSKIERAVGICYHPITRRPYAASDLKNNILNLNIAASYPVFPLLIFYNSSGNETLSVSNYGVYLSVNPPTVNDNIADSPIVTINTPIFRAVCNNSSFSTGSAAEIIPSQSTIKLKGEIYRMPKPNLHGWIYQQLVDIYNNGL